MLHRMLPSLFLVASAARIVRAFDTAFDLNFNAAVDLQPIDAWITTNRTCDGETDHYTTQINASATFSFTGDRLQIFTIGTEASGIVAVVTNSELAGSRTVMYDLHTSDINCGLLLDQHLQEEGEYTVSLILMGPSALVNGSINPEPEMHLAGISYFVSDTTQTSTGAPSPPTSSAPAGDATPNSETSTSLQSSSRHTGAIVGGVLGGVVLLLLVLALFFVVRKRMTSRRLHRREWALRVARRHTFNPTSPMHITELSPRSTARNADSSFDSDAAKLQPYVRMEDYDIPHAGKGTNPFISDEDDTNPSNLAVPTVSRISLKSGGSSGMRSRSPAPKEEN
ncbi:hypothetical protein BC835DRAFT_607745 [Cytidiella melzeri]|nr:hypothetical protein BC835DRAFT_607745 [Cytidiella melzeri]